MYATVCVVYATVGNLVLCVSQEKRKEYDSQHDKMDMEAAMVSYARAFTTTVHCVVVALVIL